MERKLAAILAADVVGYSRLMEADEVGTLAALKSHRDELIDPTIAEHHGHIVKLMGDGALIEFASVVDAVACALAIQEGMAGRNEGTAEDRRLEFRIGVHLGDVIVEGDHLHGDGVNVAARLEGLAKPGGICLSQQAFDQIETKLELAYEDLGERRVKITPSMVVEGVVIAGFNYFGIRPKRGQPAVNITVSLPPDFFGWSKRRREATRGIERDSSEV